LIVLLSDHGHPHGDHGSIMKTVDNLYSELLRIPLLIRHPDGLYAGQRVDALVQTCDLLPTILSLLGLERETVAMHGQNVWSVVTGEREKLRDYIVVGYHDAEHRCVRDQEWSYIRRPRGRRDERFAWHYVPDPDGAQDELYHLTTDPQEKNNVIEQYPAKAEELAAHLGQYFQATGPKISSLQLRDELSGTAIK
jgi:arylsulfatase A-like enzyme